MKLSELTVDVDRGEKGAWVDNIPELEGLRLKVRSNNNADWRKLQARLMDAMPRKKRLGGRLDPDEQDRVISTCLLNTCLLDWEGLENGTGEPLPYSKELARKLLFEPEYRRFRDAVIWAAAIVAEEQAEEEEDAKGNLSGPSAGNTGGAASSPGGSS
jgi:hypothetical protein